MIAFSARILAVSFFRLPFVAARVTTCLLALEASAIEAGRLEQKAMLEKEGKQRLQVAGVEVAKPERKGREGQAALRKPAASRGAGSSTGASTFSGSSSGSGIISTKDRPFYSEQATERAFISGNASLFGWEWFQRSASHVAARIHNSSPRKERNERSSKKGEERGKATASLSEDERLCVEYMRALEICSSAETNRTIMDRGWGGRLMLRDHFLAKFVQAYVHHVVGVCCAVQRSPKSRFRSVADAICWRALPGYGGCSRLSVALDHAILFPRAPRC